MMINSVEERRRQVWRDKFPALLVALLSLFEMVLCFAILGCEIPSIFYHFPRMNAFVGYWAFPFLTCAWISLSGAGCCCRRRCCGIAALVFQCLAMMVAVAIIGLDTYFLYYPTYCFFSSDCSTYSGSYYNSYSSSSYSNFYLNDTSTLYGIRVPATKGQLAAGVLMLVSCVVFIIIFAVSNYRVNSTTYAEPVVAEPMNTMNPYQHPAPYTGIPPREFDVQQPVVVVSANSPEYKEQTNTVPKSVATHELTCPRCGKTFEIDI